ncbi:hypothetical protein QYQ98_09990 [Corynebacterium sp. P3-F1]|uniref:hypothetical protein n=1 Tax=Corynebacterium sp. P3-F1 TaxID=3059080 RepID=UPI00265CC77C|nr:hypothetical protein [Corynebacterium sp. P3-F1]WKK61324.1 hypothetical protein QYQ98_09990 [Corynebacterium sp. P3-F1]
MTTTTDTRKAASKKITQRKNELIRRQNRKAENIRLIEEAPVVFSHMQRAQRIVDASGVVPLIEQWRIDDGLRVGQGGRPAEVSTRTALTLWVYQALIQGPSLKSHMARTVAFRINGKLWGLLGLKEEPFDITSAAAHLHVYKTWYNRISKAIDRALATCEPFPTVRKKKRYTFEEWRTISALFNPETASKDVLEKIELKKKRGLEVSNRLIWATVELMDKKHLDQWQGDIVVDGTPIKVTNEGNPSIKAMKDGSVKPDRKMASTPTLGWHSKETPDHNGEGKRDSVWGLEATLVAMVGDGFAQKGGHPGLILGMSAGVPGVDPSARVFESLKNLTYRPELPRRNFIADRLYSPGQNPEKFQIPMRKLGYGFVADLRRDTRGLQTVTASGAPIIDGKAYCPAILNMHALIDPYKMWEDGDLSDQAFINLLQARSKYQLSAYGKPNAKGDMRMGCPARAEGAEITCPLVPRSEEGKKAKGFQKEALSEDEVPSPGSCPKVCRQRTVTIKNSVEDGAKFLQHGPAFMSADWRKEYGRRNTIESRNSLLKNGNYQGAGDPTTRLMRGWAAQVFAIAMACVGVNIKMLDTFSWQKDKKTSQKPTPPPPTDKLTHDDLEQWRVDENAPPQAA